MQHIQTAQAFSCSVTDTAVEYTHVIKLLSSLCVTARHKITGDNATGAHWVWERKKKSQRLKRHLGEVHTPRRQLHDLQRAGSYALFSRMTDSILFFDGRAHNTRVTTHLLCCSSPQSRRRFSLFTIKGWYLVGGHRVTHVPGNRSHPQSPISSQSAIGLLKRHLAHHLPPHIDLPNGIFCFSFFALACRTNTFVADLCEHANGWR